MVKPSEGKIRAARRRVEGAVNWKDSSRRGSAVTNAFQTAVEDAEAGADGCSGIRRPGNAQARREVGVLRLEQVRISGRNRCDPSSAKTVL